MKDLIQKEKKQLGLRIRKLRELLSLSQAELGKVLAISKGTIASMEAGKKFTGDYLLSIAHFFAMDLAELAKYNDPTPNELEFRTRIKKYHIRHGSEDYKILEAPPSLNSVIEFRLLTSTFFNEPKTVNDVVEYCKSEFNLQFGSSIVSQALINLTKSGLLKRKNISGRNYNYQTSRKGFGKH